MSQDAGPSVSVIVPTFNRRARLVGIVEAVLADNATDELVVVVDGCDDGSFEMLCSMAKTEHRLRPILVPNGGAGMARQAGAEAATGDILVVLDDDVIPDPGLVGGHRRHHLHGARQVVLGYMSTRVPEPQRRGHFATALYSREYEAECEAWELDPDLVLSSLWAGNLSIRRSDALAVGFEEPSGPVPYHADQAFGLRCRDAGLSGTFDRSLRVSHEHHRTMDQFVADATSQAQGALCIHRMVQSGPYDFAAERSFRAPVRIVIRTAARPRLFRGAVTALRWAISLAGALRAFSVESDLAMVLRQVIQRRVILDLVGRSR